MRLTILAGLLMGLSLAVQATLGAHARTTLGRSVKAVGAHEKVVAPWYIATNDTKSLNQQG
jgi:hypothetical protein